MRGARPRQSPDESEPVLHERMSLTRELGAFTVTLAIRTDGGLAELVASVDHADGTEFDEDDDRDDRYRWSFAIEVVLGTGELRRAWHEGSHEDASLLDNLPGAAIYVPASALPSPMRVRVRGELALEAGPAVAWDQELGQGTVELAATSERPTIEAISPRARDASGQAISMAAASEVRIVACLPERGLVTLSRTAGYVLHGPAGERSLPELDAIIAALPGKETAVREHRGGPRGRLAIESQRDHREHVVVVEIDERGVRQLHTADDVSLTRGGFDATGALLVVRTRGRRRVDANTEVFESWTQVLDCDAAQLLDWRGPSAEPGGSWHVDREVLAGTSGTTLHEIPRRGTTSTMRIPVDVGPGPSAWNATSGVAVWAGKPGTAFPQGLHCYHPSWGVRSLALPRTGADAVAVLRDGRIVVVGDNLLLVDPESAEIVDLGPVGGYLGDLLQVIETEGAATLWTLAPARWRVELPAR